MVGAAVKWTPADTGEGSSLSRYSYRFGLSGWGGHMIARGWDLPVTVEAGNAGVDLGAARFCEECQQICYTGATEFWSRPHHLAEIRKIVVNSLQLKPS